MRWNHILLASLLIGAWSGTVQADSNRHDVYYMVVMDPTFTALEQGDIGDALEHWIVGSVGTSRPIHFQVSVAGTANGECDRFRRNNLICLHRGSVEGMPDDVVGWTITQPDEKSSDIYVKTYMTPPFLESEVWQHEIGHALGLQHTGRNTLMCRTTACSAMNVTPADLQQWEHLAQ